MLSSPWHVVSIQYTVAPVRNRWLYTQRHEGEGSQDALRGLAGYHLPVHKGRYLGRKSWDSVCNYQRTISISQEGLNPSVLVSPHSVYNREKTLRFNNPILSKHPKDDTAPHGNDRGHRTLIAHVGGVATWSCCLPSLHFMTRSE